MSKNLEQIAEQLESANKKVQLIYAFNGTGKTRLSRIFKDLIAPKNGAQNGGEEAGQVELSRNKILYYNAFTEDLFYWDNDLEGDVEPKLKIQPNSFTDWVLQEQGQDQNVVSYFQRFSSGKLTPRFNPQYTFSDESGQHKTIKAFSEVTFSLEHGDDDSSGVLKISKGEESNFVWSIFYNLLEQVIDILNVADPNERETEQFNQLKYVYIDDPVSSLDENHLIELAVNLAALIRSSYFSNDGREGLRFIISTHSTIFYNVLYNELKLKNGYILSKFDDETFELEEKKGDSNKSFSYHLHIKRLIELAIESSSVQRYHFALLRNLYEKTANFLGYNRWSDLLPEPKKAYANRIMNFYPHNTLTNEEIAEPTAPEKEMVRTLLENLNTYGFWNEDV
jgi:hypothetical protein